MSDMVPDMMSKNDLDAHLSALQLTQTEAAQLLGVSDRTLRRWVDGEEVPGPAEAALRAWRRLAEGHLPWRPDSTSIVRDDQDQIARMRQHAVDLAGLLRRVEQRGGPRVTWSVSLPESKATLGPVQVSFYNLRNGGFSLSVYTRRDTHPDVERDWPLIEDAAFCIAAEFEKCALRAAALKAVADDVRSKATIFGTRGPDLPDRAAKAQRQQEIENLAREIDALAEEATAGRPTSYQRFAAIYRQLSDAGFSPPDRSLMSAVARSYAERKVRILFVKSGHHDSPVTKAIDADLPRVNTLIAGRHLKFLGLDMPVLPGETSALSDFAGPDHVVLEVPPGAEIAGAKESGLYLVIGVRPSML
jgi:hypothetical protein